MDLKDLKKDELLKWAYTARTNEHATQVAHEHQLAEVDSALSLYKSDYEKLKRELKTLNYLYVALQEDLDSINQTIKCTDIANIRRNGDYIKATKTINALLLKLSIKLAICPSCGGVMELPSCYQFTAKAAENTLLCTTCSP